MAQPVTAILSCQNELSAAALLHTGDVNEAGLLVGKVVSRAFRKFDKATPEDAIAAAMTRDLERLICLPRRHTPRSRAPRTAGFQPARRLHAHICI